MSDERESAEAARLSGEEWAAPGVEVTVHPAILGPAIEPEEKS